MNMNINLNNITMGNICGTNTPLTDLKLDFEKDRFAFFKIHEDKAKIVQEKWRLYLKRKREREQQLAKTEILDNNLSKYGRYVDADYLKSKISPKVFETQKTLPMYLGEPNEKEYLEINKLIRKPLEYFLDKSIYHGAWNPEGLRQGYGSLVRENGAKLEGLWKSGELYKGRIIDNQGNYYEGKIKNFEANGEGTFKGVNGYQFIGFWKEGVYDGYGQLYYPDKTIFKGNFLVGEFNGAGIIRWPDEIVFEGQFNKSTIQGKGKIVNIDGDNYIGLWENNLPHGQGTFEWKKHQTKYVGEYKYGRKDGKGKYIFPDGEYYDGDWHNDKPHGNGVYKTKQKEIKGTWRYGNLLESENSGDTSRKSGYLVEFIKSDTILPHLKYYIQLPKSSTNQNSRIYRPKSPKSFAELIKI
jgi:hypothetical protein